MSSYKNAIELSDSEYITLGAALKILKEECDLAK